MKTYDERMESVQKKLQRRRTQLAAMKATACLLCICLLVGILLPHFQKPDDLAQYAENEYYKVIEAINRDFPRKEDGWQGFLWEDLFWADAEDAVLKEEVSLAPGAAPDAKPSVGVNTNSSVEITDHQVAGVLEADIIKRSQTHIFYLNGNTLEVYPIVGLDTELLGTWCMETNKGYYYYSAEMYLSADATRINLVIPGYGDVFQSGKNTAFVQVVSLDVSDPANVKQANCLYVTGSLLSTRMVGDQMLLVAQYRMDNDIDFDDESTFLPQYGVPEDMQTVPAENIVVPEKLSNRTYTVITLLDGKDMTILDSGAFMSYSAELYVSKDQIYATRSYTGEEKVDDVITLTKAMTEISCMRYEENGLTLAGSFHVEGTVKNQYSMDEHEGVFRIVTGTTQRQTVTHETGYTTVHAEERNANLTCFKVGTWEQLAQVARFAPDGETVESVRFDGDYAYVCTAVVVTLTDPVFFFDMTDLSHITVKDTGTIDGYSSSLVQLKDGFLLGIGMNDQRHLKVEIYRETETGVESVCVFEEDMGTLPTSYKAYYIDREHNLFGIPTGAGYILLSFDGYQLQELARAKFTGYGDKTRGVVIENYLYVFGDRWFDVVKI